jgi:F-type H+-transporting ATPase subunit b
VRFLSIIAAEGGTPIDDARSVHWLWPAQAELIYGTAASIIIFALLYKFAGPAVRKAFADRTTSIQDELDSSAQANAEATAEAAQIRRAAGDIDAERQRLFAEADAQAEQLLADGRSRLDEEIAELRARAESDMNATANRAGDELRAEISGLAAAATDRLLAEGLDGATQQELIESFIAKVGQS